MPDPTTDERFALPSRLDEFREGSLERRSEIASIVVEASQDLFGEGASLVATHADHINVLTSEGTVIRVECEWDGDELNLGEISMEGSVFADRTEVSKFIAKRMNMASQLLIEGRPDDADAVLRDCAGLLERGAGSWAVEDYQRELEERATEERSWRALLEAHDADLLVEQAVRSGINLSELRESSEVPRKELIQDALALMIAKTERLVEISGEHLVEHGDSATPETRQVLKSLAHDAALLGECLEESLECVRYTQETVLRKFYETASNQLTEMALAFTAAIVRSTNESQ